MLPCIIYSSHRESKTEIKLNQELGNQILRNSVSTPSQLLILKELFSKQWLFIITIRSGPYDLSSKIIFFVWNRIPNQVLVPCVKLDAIILMFFKNVLTFIHFVEPCAYKWGSWFIVHVCQEQGVL